MGTDQKTPRPSGIDEQSVAIPCGNVELAGDLCVAPGASGIVLFAHGSGSGRHSPRNRFVAGRLHRANLATLLFDLLTVEEEREDMMTGHLRFNISLLARRLSAATAWARSHPSTRHLAVGYFGASTGAAAALAAAAAGPGPIAAIVSRGGRPDLALEALRHVDAPTLLIVGEKDHAVLAYNREALAALTCERSLAIVPRATHLFEEAGTLEQAADLAADWFSEHFETLH